MTKKNFFYVGFIKDFLIVSFTMVFCTLLGMAWFFVPSLHQKDASSSYAHIVDEDEKFDAIYEDFISSYSYIDLSFKEKLGRFIGTSSLEARERKGGECWELCNILRSDLSSSGFFCRICLGLDVSHTWIEVYLDGEWLTFDPTDDIYRYNHNQTWGLIRDYENLKKLDF